jgi:hypothetical protein
VVAAVTVPASIGSLQPPVSVSDGCRFVAVRQLIPEDLAEVPPGPELARILAGIELLRLCSGRVRRRRSPHCADSDRRAADTQFWLAQDC